MTTVPTWILSFLTGYCLFGTVALIFNCLDLFRAVKEEKKIPTKTELP